MEYYKNLSLEPLFYINDEGLVCQEEFRGIVGYESLYQVSDLGRVKRFSRIVREKSSYRISEKILKQAISKRGCLVFCIKNKEGKLKAFKTHQLVAMAFLNHIPCGYKIVVDHIDNNPLNNCLSNLQLISQRENASKDKKNKTSKYTGVSWNKENNLWVSAIRISGFKIVLYNGNDEEKANLLYLKAKENTDLFKGNVKDFREKIGVVHSNKKLTEEKVRLIRRLHRINKNFDREIVLKKYNIKKGCLYDVLTYKNWKNVF